MGIWGDDDAPDGESLDVGLIANKQNISVNCADPIYTVR
jgi:hypothetical protein